MENLFVLQISCGTYHSVLLVEPALIYSCGLNKFGQLGTGDLVSRNKFTLCKSMQGKSVMNVTAGGNHSVFILDKNNLYDPKNYL